MSFYHASRNIIERVWLPVAVGLATLSAVLLPLNLLAVQRLHHDEALYATWALKIASGQDVWLADTPIDKPPLYLYTVAAAMKLLGATETATRVPSLLATAISVLLTFWLGRVLYGNATGVLAAWLVALSPFTMLFAPTAFTDPMLMALMLAGCLAAAYHRAGWSGFFLGLAIATKQQGVFFVPLALGLLLIRGSEEPRAQGREAAGRGLTADVMWFGFGLLVTLLPAFAWDAARNQPSGFWELSLTNYGGLALNLAGFAERWAGFLKLLFYATASPLLNTIFLIGWPLLLVFGLWQFLHIKNPPQGPIASSPHSPTLPLPLSQLPTPNSLLPDCLFTLFILGFLLLHATLSFQVWDRYLLGLIPFLAILLARVLLLPWAILTTYRPEKATFWPASAMALVITLLLGFSLARPVQDAANARYPLGSNSQALSGIEQIVAYLQGQVGANHTLYHRWLGTHWRFYLAGYPYDLQVWDNPMTLARQAKAGHFIAFPTVHSDTEARIALYRAGLTLHEVARAYAPNGAPSIILYRLENIDN